MGRRNNFSDKRPYKKGWSTFFKKRNPIAMLLAMFVIYQAVAGLRVKIALTVIFIAIGLFVPYLGRIIAEWLYIVILMAYFFNLLPFLFFGIFKDYISSAPMLKGFCFVLSFLCFVAAMKAVYG